MSTTWRSIRCERLMPTRRANPPTIAVYHSGETVVAVDDDGVVARDTDAQTVWQAAVDQLNAAYDPAYKFQPVGIIDGGFEAFDLDSTLTLKEGAIVQNARFEAADVTTGWAVVIGGPDDGYTHGGVRAHNILVRDAGNRAIEVRDLTSEIIGPLVAVNAADHGIRINSTITCQFHKLHARNCGNVGIEFDDRGASGNRCNLNVFLAPRAQKNAATGIRNTGHNGHSNLFLAPAAEGNGSHGISDGVQESKYLLPHLEANGGRGVLCTGARTIIEKPRMFYNEGGTGEGQGIRIAGCPGARILGPIGGNDQIACAAGPDIRLEQVEAGDIFVNNAARTRWNEIIGGGPLGGYDISTLTGAKPGDLARSNGATAAQAEDALYILKSTGDWQALHDPTVTITPA